MTYGNGTPHMPSHKDLPSNSSGKGSGAPQTNSGKEQDNRRHGYHLEQR